MRSPPRPLARNVYLPVRSTYTTAIPNSVQDTAIFAAADLAAEPGKQQPH